ncbi:MAG TPA: pyridoxal-phosphate dependent enzyme [Gemmatimonadaceae bacterium]|nr:pyridoxal-phosphate dependent enzyme [Gemmatimonadaceae bacterium]
MKNDRNRGGGASARLSAPSLDAIRAARERIDGIVIRTPLVRIDIPGDEREIYLKLENLQPIGSFKLRGAANAMAQADAGALARGVYTASAGNMAQAIAWEFRRQKLEGRSNDSTASCTAVVPDRAPQVKLDALQRLGARVVKVSFDEWWKAMVEHKHQGIDGVFVHPFEDTNVMAGNGTIGLEILEDVPDVDAILVPWGGGGLACGIASAVRALSPATRVYPIEVDTAAPLTASYAANAPATITPTPSFVDGMGGKSVFPSMWPLAQELLQRPLVVSVAQISDAVRMVVQRARIVAEGAGAAPLAAALAHVPDARRIVCMVSGGNLDPATLAELLGQ